MEKKTKKKNKTKFAKMASKALTSERGVAVKWGCIVSLAVLENVDAFHLKGDACSRVRVEQIVHVIHKKNIIKNYNNNNKNTFEIIN